MKESSDWAQDPAVYKELLDKQERQLAAFAQRLDATDATLAKKLEVKKTPGAAEDRIASRWSQLAKDDTSSGSEGWINGRKQAWYKEKQNQEVHTVYMQSRTPSMSSRAPKTWLGNGLRQEATAEAAIIQCRPGSANSAWSTHKVYCQCSKCCPTLGRTASVTLQASGSGGNMGLELSGK